MKEHAIYAGSFDPITLGHYDLVQRSAALFDRLILAVAASSPKETMFTLDERLDQAREVVKSLKNVEVEAFSGLVIDYARSCNVRVMIRGLRAHADFEYEFRMALTNRKLAPEIETLFMMPKETHSYVSSSMVKEVAALGGDVSDFVPAVVLQALDAKLKP
ncbi:MAG: pantetheine-phosphate adenylyltransferase [Verrucomicrobia bacterium]|nr:pantetheine-phosphate adenylyltransferase [Verrucomicrobiota bacterium]